MLRLGLQELKNVPCPLRSLRATDIVEPDQDRNEAIPADTVIVTIESLRYWDTFTCFSPAIDLFSDFS
ncbi:hypothetical protein FOBRF1_003821 [Fusarium oxysporum]